MQKCYKLGGCHYDDYSYGHSYGGGDYYGHGGGYYAPAPYYY